MTSCHPEGRPYRHYGARISYACVKCRGRGWILHRAPGGVDTWPVHCTACRGRGSVSRRGLGLLLREHPETIQSVDDLRARPTTARRVFRKIAKLAAKLGAEL